MPEGDTLVRTADGLRPYLVGRTVTAASARAPGPRVERLVGATVTGVEAQGKNLLIRFDNGLEVRTHLRMHGSWHRYRPGERWRRAARAGAARDRGPGLGRGVLRRPDGRAVRAAGRGAAPGARAARAGPPQGPVRRRRGAAAAPGPVPGGPVHRGGDPGPARARRHRQRGEERGPVAGAGVPVDAVGDMDDAALRAAGRPRPRRPARGCRDRSPPPARLPASWTPVPSVRRHDPRRAPGPGSAAPHLLVPACQPDPRSPA